MPGFVYTTSSEFQPANNIGGNKDIHRVHRWRIDTLVGEGHRDLKMYAKSVTLPTITMEVENGPGVSMDYKFASKATFDDVTVVFYDVDGLYEHLDKMMASVWTERDGVGLANNYKANTVLILETPMSQWTEFTLVNSWVKALAHSPLTYDSSELKVVTVTLAYDWHRVKNVENKGQCGASQETIENNSGGYSPVVSPGRTPIIGPPTSRV